MKRAANVLWLLAIAACSSDAVLAVDIDCTETAHCPRGQHCQKIACGDATGFCKANPKCDEKEDAPVCGCDGITYRNDCVRIACSAAASSPGTCSTWSGPPVPIEACVHPIRSHY